jgi:hypothetical protein
MNFEDLKEQLSGLSVKLQEALQKLQENPTWIQFSEKYHDLSPRAQKAAIGGAAFLIFLILISLPYLYYSTSQDAVSEFETKKQLIRDLYRVSHASSILQNAPPTANSMDLMARAQGQLQTAQLQPEQIIGVTEYDNSANSGNTIPKNVIQKGIQVALGKLNLRQIIDIGYQMQTIHPSAKMTGLEITANREDVHYFDVIYHIVSFSLPEPPAPAANPANKNSRFKPSSSRPTRQNKE